MRLHFGQNDAAMNKLAGCNSLPNAGRTFDLTELEQKAREAGCETPFEYLSHHDKRIQQNIDDAAQGYNAAKKQIGQWVSGNGCADMGLNMNTVVFPEAVVGKESAGA